jgi:hypothetical protein
VRAYGIHVDVGDYPYGNVGQLRLIRLGGIFYTQQLMNALTVVRQNMVDGSLPVNQKATGFAAMF